MRTQNKENYYYMFWVVAMVAFIVPQVFTAIAYNKLSNILDKPLEVEVKDMGFEVAEEWEMDDGSIELVVNRWI